MAVGKSGPSFVNMLRAIGMSFLVFVLGVAYFLMTVIGIVVGYSCKYLTKGTEVSFDAVKRAYKWSLRNRVNVKDRV